MSEIKTKKNNNSIEDFLNSVEDLKKRQDCFTIHEIMKEISGDEGAMWGSSIIGYGSCHFIYSNGKEGDWMAMGFSPRKTAITLYIMAGFSRYEKLLEKLGNFKTGKSCLYIKKLEDIDQKVLKELIKESFSYITKKYPH